MKIQIPYTSRNDFIQQFEALESKENNQGIKIMVLPLYNEIKEKLDALIKALDLHAQRNYELRFTTSFSNEVYVYTIRVRWNKVFVDARTIGSVASLVKEFGVELVPNTTGNATCEDYKPALPRLFAQIFAAA